MSSELDIGIGTAGMEAFSTTTTSSFTTNASNACLYGLPSTHDTLRVDDLLDFSTTHEGFLDAAHVSNNNNSTGHLQHHHLPHTEVPFSSSAPVNYSYSYPSENNSSAGLAVFPDDLYMPSEEAAELEWLSKFVEDSFSDMPFPHTAGSIGSFSDAAPLATGDTNSNTVNNNNNAFPGRARSKRSRAPSSATHLTAAAAWSSLPPSRLSTSPSSSSSSSSETKHRVSGGGGKKKDMMAMMMTPPGAGGAAATEGSNGGVRKCTHCSSEKTPQWRTGPLGPKTLCNACGVRYKSGRLVPEYRPASSPTFVLTQHSNSHRKVMELRRQKELLLRHRHQQHRELSSSNPDSTTPPTTRPDLLLRDYEVTCNMY